MSLDDFPRVRCCSGRRRSIRSRLTAEHLGGATSGPSARTATAASRSAATRTRKLEYLVADALAQGCDTLVSIGGVQSNHTRQVAAVAAPRSGLGACSSRSTGSTGRTSVYDRVGNILLSRLMGADVAARSRPASASAFKESWEQALARRRGRAAASRTRSRPAPPTTRSAGSASPAGPTRSPSRSGSSASSSTPSSCARSPARPRRG